MKQSVEQQLDPETAEKRFVITLKTMLATPPQPRTSGRIKKTASSKPDNAGRKSVISK